MVAIHSATQNPTLDCTPLVLSPSIYLLLIAVRRSFYAQGGHTVVVTYSGQVTHPGCFLGWNEEFDQVVSHITSIISCRTAGVTTNHTWWHITGQVGWYDLGCYSPPWQNLSIVHPSTFMQNIAQTRKPSLNERNHQHWSPLFPLSRFLILLIQPPLSLDALLVKAWIRGHITTSWC